MALGAQASRSGHLSSKGVESLKDDAEESSSPANEMWFFRSCAMDTPSGPSRCVKTLAALLFCLLAWSFEARPMVTLYKPKTDLFSVTHE